jgi:TolB-like protein/DNA-binding winged helix-turn-helix (wHTH) protein
MNKAVKCWYEFGPFLLDPGERLVRHGAARMELPPRAFDTLVALVENNGRLLEKDELMRTVWGATVVEENNLSQVIYLLRKALRDGEDGTRYIETVPKRGYRFVAEVRELEPDEVASVTPVDWNQPQLTNSGGRAATVEPQRSASGRRGWWQGLVAGLAVVAVAALSQGAGWKQRLFGEVQSSRIRSIAVLPLQNLSNDPNQEYFVDGMTDELITDLAQIRELKVVSKTSIMQYKGTRMPLPQIGRDLGVDAVVEGSVLRSGDRVRITAQLIRTATDRHIWAAAYDGDLKDVLSLQARVAEAITNQVKLNLTAEESGRLRRAPSVNPDAFDLYLRGRYAWNQRNVAGFQQAIRYFSGAIEQDSNFALAYSGLADSYTLLALYGEGATSMTEAKAAAEKALQLDGTLAEAHTSLAAVRVLHDWDWPGAEQEFHRALELNPNFAQAHHWYGNLLLGPEGRHEEAIAELQRAKELDPLSPILKADTGFAYYLAGRNDLALQAYHEVVAANPKFVPVHFYLMKYYLQSAQYDLWLKESVEDRSLADPASRTQSLQQVYAEGGFRAVMEEMAKPREASRLAAFRNEWLDACGSAEANIELGKNAAALNALEECHRRSASALLYLKVDPVWTNLRREPRYQDLLRRLNLQ